MRQDKQMILKAPTRRRNEREREEGEHKIIKRKVAETTNLTVENYTV